MTGCASQYKLSVDAPVLEISPDRVALHLSIEDHRRKVSDDLKMHRWGAIRDLRYGDSNCAQLHRAKGPCNCGIALQKSEGHRKCRTITYPNPFPVSAQTRLCQRRSGGKQTNTDENPGSELCEWEPSHTSRPRGRGQSFRDLRVCLPTAEWKRKPALAQFARTHCSAADGSPPRMAATIGACSFRYSAHGTS